MLKRIKTVTLLLACLILVACSQSLDKTARDTSAALGGALKAAQTQHQASCEADKTQAVCVNVNKAISGQNALITATETYCGWSAADTLPSDETPCVPVKSAEPALKTAIANANQFINELKGTVK